PETLERAILGVARRGTDLAAAHEALGDVTIEELSARIAAEVHRGLVESQRQGSLGATVPFGEGVDVLAAVWSAVARVREIATLRSGGSLRFEATGPEGAIPLAPWASPDRRAGERNTRGSRGHDGVRLEGRLAVVADDDPSVVWFLSGLLKTAGVDVLEAHDGKRALELTLSRWPDLVVSDVLMPKMDGFSLCRAIKRDVAVRDVPVVLLSWKEDLLQRLRELGADADAYLRKEAAGTTVLERIREVLRPRARVEARMVTGGVVRGRLDGLTPRLVLELACGRHRDCRVSFRDSVYLYEVDIRGGHPVNATRTATDGGFARGEKVIAALLGIGAGRFSVAPESMVCRDNLNKSLADLLSPHIMRARRAQDAVVGGLDRIDSIQIDVEAISAYLAATPDPALHLLQRLTSGHSPAELARDPETDRQALEAV
ncbi:MAG TPA: response regulator, partial [Polyangiaceae bacterium]|nr:response regulator [Polyangiaceae bacterium]